MANSDQSNTSENNSFWSTLPGILTALTGFLGAIGALLTVLHQIGWVAQPNADSRPSSAPLSSTETSSRSDQGSGAIAPASGSDRSTAPAKTDTDTSAIHQSNVPTSPLSVAQESSNPDLISQSSSTNVPTHAAPTKGNEMRTVTAQNVARQINARTWEWQIFIQGSEQTLAQVECVEYHLHPTFAEPKQTICQKGNSSRAFPLTATAWGTFPVEIRVLFKDGQVQELTHELHF